MSSSIFTCGSLNGYSDRSTEVYQHIFRLLDTTDTYSDSVMYLTAATAKAIAGNQASEDIAQARLKCIAATAQELLQVEDIDAMRIGLRVIVNLASKSAEALKSMPRGVRKVIE